MAFLLMTDGTVKYIPILYSLKNENFMYFDVNNISKIVKFESAFAEPKNSLTGSGPTILGFKKDGTIYDLKNHIDVKKYYYDII